MKNKRILNGGIKVRIITIIRPLKYGYSELTLTLNYSGTIHYNELEERYSLNGVKHYLFYSNRDYKLLSRCCILK